MKPQGIIWPNDHQQGRIEADNSTIAIARVRNSTRSRERPLLYLIRRVNQKQTNAPDRQAKHPGSHQFFLNPLTPPPCFFTGRAESAKGTNPSRKTLAGTTHTYLRACNSRESRPAWFFGRPDTETDRPIPPKKESQRERDPDPHPDDERDSSKSKHPVYFSFFLGRSWLVWPHFFLRQFLARGGSRA